MITRVDAGSRYDRKRAETGRELLSQVPASLSVIGLARAEEALGVGRPKDAVKSPPAKEGALGGQHMLRA